MFKFEIKKYLNNKMIMFIVLGLALIKVAISYFSLNISVPYNTMIYERYLVRWDGELTNAKADEIETEKLRLDTIISQYPVYEKMYQDGEISFDEFLPYAKEHETSDVEYKAFTPVYEKYMYFQTTDEYTEFFYDLEIIEFMELFQKDIILMLLLCVVISIVTDVDQNNDLYSVVRTQPNGRRRFELTKIIAVVVVSGVFATLFVGLDYIIYAIKYSFEHWDRTIYSIQSINKFAFNTSITSHMLLLSLIKVGAAMVVGGIVYVINKLFKKMFLSIFISVVVFVVFSVLI